jgi:hypothetical protein
MKKNLMILKDFLKIFFRIFLKYFKLCNPLKGHHWLLVGCFHLQVKNGLRKIVPY